MSNPCNQELTDQINAKIELLEQKINDLEHKINYVVYQDSLTTLLNHRAICTKIKDLLRAKKKNEALYVAMFDIDDFKQINDRYGHQTGDQVIIQIAKILKDVTKDVGYAGRYGGDEFIIVFSVEDALNANLLISEVLNRVYKLTIKTDLKVTLSGGVTKVRTENSREIIQKVDQLLYESKRVGKNKVSYDLSDS
ncbi:GGDEF domain-containing protein [Haloplasma contractile]|uniref:Response regulator protein n=1 Tax=Haloplasma contractile SSD-17B TaxID=1033810 RepID=U2FIR2_9MOLU|nr:GGDEF domain-containing protein [Haloplasma contractile]ERJ11134.1 response regulator protein [Haloplasma contractile SSD-17B]